MLSIVPYPLVYETGTLSDIQLTVTTGTKEIATGEVALKGIPYICSAFQSVSKCTFSSESCNTPRKWSWYLLSPFTNEEIDIQRQIFLSKWFEPVGIQVQIPWLQVSKAPLLCSASVS